MARFRVDVAQQSFLEGTPSCAVLKENQEENRCAIFAGPNPPKDGPICFHSTVHLLIWETNIFQTAEFFLGTCTTSRTSLLNLP